MTRTSLVAVLCALVLGSCVHHPRAVRLPDPSRPQVLVAPGGYLVVNQEPVVVLRPRGATAVVNWQLAPDSGFQFEEKGIEILGRIKDFSKDGTPTKRDVPDRSQVDQFKCVTVNRGLEVNCVIPPSVAPGQYAYALISRDRNGKRVVLDPSFWVTE